MSFSTASKQHVFCNAQCCPCLSECSVLSKLFSPETSISFALPSDVIVFRNFRGFLFFFFCCRCRRRRCCCCLFPQRTFRDVNVLHQIRKANVQTINIRRSGRLHSHLLYIINHHEPISCFKQLLNRMSAHKS